MSDFDVSAIGDVGGFVGLFAVIGLVGWQAWKQFSPSISKDISRIEQTKGVAHDDLMTRFDRIRNSEKEALERLDELGASLDVERALRRDAEDAAARERIKARSWELRYRRAVEELVSLGREDLATVVDQLNGLQKKTIE